MLQLQLMHAFFGVLLIRAQVVSKKQDLEQ